MSPKRFSSDFLGQNLYGSIKFIAIFFIFPKGSMLKQFVTLYFRSIQKLTLCKGPLNDNVPSVLFHIGKWYLSRLFNHKGALLNYAP